MRKASEAKRVRDDDPADTFDISKAKVVGRGLHAKRGARLPLRSLREAAGKTQVEVAAAMDSTQGEVSRLEQREDALVSTLRRYVEALGGRLDVVAVFDKTGHRIPVDL